MRGTDLGGSGRKGLTGAGGSTATQTEQWGVTVVEQRSSRGHRQGGRGSSQCRCGAWGTHGVFGEGPEWRSMVAQRCQARWRSCVEAEEEKGSLHGGGGCSFYNRWRRLAKAARAASEAVAAAKPWARQSGGGHGPNAVGTGSAVGRIGRLTGGP
jgi:hypothetical protein